MRPIKRAFLLAALATLAGGRALAANALSTGPALGAALASGTVDPATVDFGALRYGPGAAMGFLTAQSTAEAAIAKAHSQPTLRAATAAHVCLGASEAATVAGFNSALLAVDADDWRTQKAAADTALAHYAEAKTALEADAPAPYPEFQSVAEAMAQAKGATRPELKALFQHEAQDRLWRRALLGVQPKAYAGSLGKAGKVIVNARLEAEGCAIETANAAWLDKTLDAIPWFTIDPYGKAADEAASNIARHADAAPALQLKVLSRLGPLALAKRTDPKSFAALWDKVALSNGRPQRYGTQMRCIGKAWAPITPVEDASTLDKRRGWVGLPPMRTYSASTEAVCGG